MSRDNNVGGVMVAFVLGALTGAAVALLFAPASGEETREFLGQKARESRDRARDTLDQGREFYRQNRETIASALERGREAFQQARERGDQA
jgi:gas vesicle protein